MASEALTRRLLRAFSAVNRRLYEWTGGAVGGSFSGAPVLLLRTVGRRSGKVRTTPLLYLADGDRYVLVASVGGAPTHPAWFLNLRANPDVEVQIRRDRLPVRAREADAEERARLWRQVVAMYSDYEVYQQRTSRTIPLVVLAPRP